MNVLFDLSNLFALFYRSRRGNLRFEFCVNVVVLPHFLFVWFRGRKLNLQTWLLFGLNLFNLLNFLDLLYARAWLGLGRLLRLRNDLPDHRLCGFVVNSFLFPVHLRRTDVHLWCAWL